MHTAIEDSYVSAIECKRCQQFFSVQLCDLIDPPGCPFCGGRDIPLSQKALTGPVPTRDLLRQA